MRRAVHAGRYALAAALLFGAGAPLAKRLLERVGPVALAGLLYLGAGAALGAVSLGRRAAGRSAGASPTRRELPRLVAVAFLGGLVAPVTLVLGLARVSATAGSLLLTLETPFTIGLAALVLGEPAGGRAGVAATLLFGGALAMSFALAPGAVGGSLAGAALVAFACLAWAADNTLTRALAGRDPILVVTFKALLAAPVALGAAWALGEPLPATSAIAAALAVGAVSYGASLALYTRSLRELGVARTGALFSVAPFAGALAAWPLAGESPQPALVPGAALMALGVWLLATERHAHAHVHEPVEHEHAHVTDEHHRHVHADGDAPEPHTHRHAHEQLEHAHVHAVDAEHRHRH